MKNLKNNKGFSLVELIIVVAIMAILIGILAPQYLKYVERSRLTSDNDIVDTVRKAMETVASDPNVNSTLTEVTATIDNTNGVVLSSNGTALGSGDAFYDAFVQICDNPGDRKFKSKTYANANAVTVVLQYNGGQVTFTVNNQQFGS